MMARSGPIFVLLLCCFLPQLASSLLVAGTHTVCKDFRGTIECNPDKFLIASLDWRTGTISETQYVKSGVQMGIDGSACFFRKVPDWHDCEDGSGCTILVCPGKDGYVDKCKIPTAMSPVLAYYDPITNKVLIKSDWSDRNISSVDLTTCALNPSFAHLNVTNKIDSGLPYIIRSLSGNRNGMLQGITGNAGQLFFSVDARTGKVTMSDIQVSGFPDAMSSMSYDSATHSWFGVVAGVGKFTLVSIDASTGAMKSFDPADYPGAMGPGPIAVNSFLAKGMLHVTFMIQSGGEGPYYNPILTVDITSGKAAAGCEIQFPADADGKVMWYTEGFSSPLDSAVLMV